MPKTGFAVNHEPVIFKLKAVAWGLLIFKVCETDGPLVSAEKVRLDLSTDKVWPWSVPAIVSGSTKVRNVLRKIVFSKRGNRSGRNATNAKATPLPTYFATVSDYRREVMNS